MSPLPNVTRSWASRTTTAQPSGCSNYGYLAAKLNRNIIDTSRIENDLRHVFETCHGHPDMTIVAAFKTLRPKGH